MSYKILVITGPSGFKKSEIHKYILNKNPKIIKAISYTDRPPLVDEIDGIDFKFISSQKFTEMILNEEFLEWQQLISNNYRYGKTKKDFEEAIKLANNEKIVSTIVNIVNVPVFKRFYPESKVVYIDVKNDEAIIQMLERYSNPKDNVNFKKRYKFAIEERRRRHLADYYIKMNDIENITNIAEELLNLIDKIFDNK